MYTSEPSVCNVDVAAGQALTAVAKVHKDMYINT